MSYINRRNGKKRGGQGLPNLYLDRIQSDFTKQNPTDDDLTFQIHLLFTTLESMYDKLKLKEISLLSKVRRMQNILLTIIRNLKREHPRDYVDGHEYAEFLETLHNLCDALNKSHKKEEYTNFLVHEFKALHQTFTEAMNALEAVHESDKKLYQQSRINEQLSKRTITAMRIRDELETSLKSNNFDDNFRKAITKIFEMIDKKDSNRDMYISFLKKFVEIIPTLENS